MSYTGNKRNEMIDIYDSIKENIKNVNYIIEPYCGSCSMSYYIWSNNKDNDNLTYILNDNDEYLYEMFLILKDDDKIKEFEDKIKDIMIYIDKDKEKYNIICKEKNVYSWFIKNKYYSIRPGLFPVREINRLKCDINLKKIPIYDFFNKAKIEYYKDNGLNIYKKYKDNDKALILLDPPYLFSYNLNYQSKIDINENIYDYLYRNKINYEKAKIYLILEDNFIIKCLFENNIIKSYNKIYEVSKKKTNHLIISNIKIENN